MSENNESKLVFDTLIGSDTLTRALEKQLDIAVHLTTELGKIKTKVADAKAPLDATGISLVGVSSLRTTVELYHKLLEGKEAVAKMSTKLGFEKGDLTTLEGVLNAMTKLVGVTEKYSQLSNKKLQLAAFDGTLTKEQFDQHKGNINALKAMNKGFAQGQAHLDAEAQKWAKEGIKLVEEHTAALRKQNQEKLAGERQTAAEQRNRVIAVAREIKEGKDHSKFIKNASALEANQLKLKLQNESLKAGLTADQQVRISTGLGATLNRLETLKAPKLTALKELEFFNQLQGGSSKAKAQGTIALQEMAQHIRQLQKMGKADELLKWTETYQQSKSAFATKFAPISPHQEQLKESRRVAEAQKLPIAEVLKLTDKGDVAKQYRLSDIRAKALPEGDKKDAEIRYQDQVKAHGVFLREEEKQQKADKAAEQKIDDTASLKAIQRERKEQDKQKAIDEKAKAQDAAKEVADKAAEQRDRDLTAKKVLKDRLQQEYARQAAVAEAQGKGDKLTLATEPPKTDFDLKRSKDLNIFQKARQGQLSPQELQDFITKGSQDPKRLVRELGAIQKQSRSAELDPNVIALHSNRPSLLQGHIGIELSRLTQIIKDINKHDVEDRKKTASQQAIKDNRLLEFQEKARLGQLTTADIKSEKDKTLLHSMKKGYGDTAYDNKLSPTVRADALQMRNLIDEQLKVISAKPAKVLDEVAKHAELNRLARNIELLDPKHANTSSELGTRSIEQKTKQLNKTKELERAAASQYLTTQSLNGLSAEELTHAKKIINYRNNIAGANQAQADVELKLLSHIRVIEKAASDKAKADKKAADYAHRLNTDPAFHASELLKHQQGNLKVNSLTDRVQLAASADNRLQIKAENERTYRRDAYFGTYGNAAAIQALATPQEHKDARNSLNFQANNLPSKAERDNAEAMLRLLNEKEALEKKAIANQSLVAELAKTHYKTAAEINTLGRAELDMAKQVLAYRIKNAATQTEAYHQQELLNQASLAHQIQTKAEHRLNPEYQAENRAGSRERILGDAGASVLTIQAGLMLNYKLLAGMQGLFSNAISSVIELDSAFRQLQAISASTNTEMVSMKQNLILVAQASKFSAAEVGNTAVLLAQAGFSIGEISQSMKGVIALAQATGTELGKSVDVVTSVLSVFNKGAGETNQVVNQLTEALNRSKLDINKMSLGIQYAGNIAADSGVSFEELTSALGAMANAGIRSGSTLGTGLRQMFIDLQKPSEKLKVRLDALGLSLDQVDLHSNGLVGVLENLRNAGFTSADAFQTFEVRAASAFAALSGNISDFNDLKESLNDTNAAFEANGVQLEALAVQLDHLKSNLGILSAEALKPVATLVRDFAKETAHMMENTKESSGALMVFGTALAGIGVAVAVGWMAKLSFELVGLLAGLWRMPAAFGAARAAMILHNTGLKVLTGETLAATAATASLWGALVRFAPLLIGVAVGVGVITAAYRSYANELGKLNDKLDQAKAAFNKAKENAATAKTAYDNVNEAIGNLTAKYGVLSESQTATTDEAQSLVTKFGEMGFAIDDLANVKVSQLMQKLQELRGELSKEYSSEVTAKFGAEINRLKAALGVANNVLGSNKFTSRSMEAEAQALQGNRKAGKGGAEAEVLRLQAYDPKVLAHVAKSLLAVKDFQKEGGVASTFNVKQAKGDLTSLIAHSNLNAFQANLVEQYFKKYVEDTFAAYDTRQSYSADVQKADFKHTRDKMSIKGMADASESGTAFSAATGSQLDFIKLSAQVDKQQSHVSLRERTLLKAKLAGEANSVVQRNIKIYDDIIRQADTELETLAQAGKAATKPYNDKLALRGTWIEQRSELQKNNSPLVDAMRRGSELSDKDKLALLENQLETEKRHLVSMEKVYDKETSISTSNKLAKGIVGQNDVIGNLIQDITRLKHKSSVELEAMLKADVQKQTYVLEDWAAKVKEHNTALTQENSKEAVDQELKLGEKNLKDYEQSYRDFKDQYDLNNELFDKEQKAIRRRFENQGKRVLNSGEMFKGLNKELSARAQEAANNSGIPQEYAQYGQGIGGFFARQAAEAKSGVVLHQLKQKKLALDFINLQSVEARFKKDSANYKVPEVEAKLAEQRKRVADLDAQILDPNTSRKDELRQTRQDLQASIDLKIKALEQHKALVKDYEEERQRLLADIENLKDDLATVDENALAFKNSFAAGRQALDAGLGTIVNDWATQTIKNIDDVEAAFKAMGLSILQSMLKVVSDRTAMAFTNLLLGKADGSTGSGLVGQLGSFLFGNMGATTATGGANLGSVASSLASTTFGALAGQGSGSPVGTNSVLAPVGTNSVLRRASGGPVSGTGIGRDSVPAMLTPNEYVLRPSAASALGKPFLDRLNATTTGSLKQLEEKAAAPQINVVQSPPTNVWVVSPDQKQQMSPQDVVVTISDDISRNGSIKRLIKQVISGEV
jgi:TP901 family phage tail tape measure protein